MNWNTLYTITTPEEHEQILLLMLKRVQKRRHRLVFVNGWLRPDRRQRMVAHFISDRRIMYAKRRHKRLWTAALSSFSVGAWLIAIVLQPLAGALLVILADLALVTILLVKPHLRWQPTYQKQHA